MKKKHCAKSIIEKHLSDTNGPPYFWYKSCALQTKSIYCSKTDIISKSRNNLKTDIMFINN